MKFRTPWPSWEEWNRSLVTASLKDVEAKETVVQMDDAVLQWTEMDMKEVKKSSVGGKISKLGSLFSKVGI